jgi:hypothetical protein
MDASETTLHILDRVDAEFILGALADAHGLPGGPITSSV